MDLFDILVEMVVTDELQMILPCDKLKSNHQVESNSLAGRFVGVSIIRPKNANQHFLVCKPFLLLPAIKINKIMSAPLADMKKNFKNWFKLHFLLQSKTIKFSD